MTEALVKYFVRDYENVKDNIVRQRYATLAGCVGIICNLFLFTLKVVIGLITKSVSITADAINNLSDGLSSVISIVGFKISSKEPDEEHPFGHGRTEYIAGLIVAFIILLVGIEFIKTSIDKIINPAPIKFSWILMGILAASLLVKLWMGMFNKDLGTRINSKVLLATMQDSINDVITTSVVIIGMVASQFTAMPIDGYVGIIVALFILYSGVNIAKDTLDPLLGQAADPQVVKEIEDLVMGLDESIIGVHDIIIHSYGEGNKLASMHVEVPDTINFIAIHEIVDRAEKIVWRKTGIYMVIHMDPISMNDDNIKEKREQTANILKNIDERLSMHDFRVVDGEKQINLIFDVVVPYEYNKADKKKILAKQIKTELKNIDERYNAIMVFDNIM